MYVNLKLMSSLRKQGNWKILEIPMGVGGSMFTVFLQSSGLEKH